MSKPQHGPSHSAYFSRSLSGVIKGDIRLLTETQTRVHLMDADGLTPTQISQRTGLSISRISNIKARLRQLGFEPLKFRRTKHELREYRAREAARAGQPDADIGRSKHEPDDDEQPDTDEPAFTDVARCQCGLMLPCHHGSNDAISLTGSIAGAVADQGDDDETGIGSTGNRRADKHRKVPKLTRTNTAGLSAAQERTQLDGAVHVP